MFEREGASRKLTTSCSKKSSNKHFSISIGHLDQRRTTKGRGVEKEKSRSKIVERRRTEPVYTYKLSYEELLKEPEPPSAVMASMYGIKGHSVPGHIQQRHAAAEEQRRQQRKNRELQALQREKRGDTGVSESAAGGGGGAAVAAAGGVDAPVAPALSAQDHQRALEESVLQHVHANVPGPRVACRPHWPHFLSSAVHRQQMPAAICTSSYMEELREFETAIARSMETVSWSTQLQEPEQEDGGGGGASTPVGLWEMYGPGSSYSRIGNNPEGVWARLQTRGKENDVSRDITGQDNCGDKIVNGEGKSSAADVPSGHQWRANARREMIAEEERNGLGARRLASTRTRARVGRGGRLVLDRLPMYLPDAAHASERGEATKTDSPRNTYNAALGANPRLYRHVYPTSLIPNSRPFAFKAAPKPGVDGLAALGTSETSTGVGTGVGTSVGTGAGTGAGSGTVPVPTAITSGTALATTSTTTASTAKQTQLKELYYLPPTHPSERGIASAQLGVREMDYYACSDSEGEDIFVPALHVIRKGVKRKFGAGHGQGDESDGEVGGDLDSGTWRRRRNGNAGIGDHDHGTRFQTGAQTSGGAGARASDHWAAEIEASGSDAFKYYPLTPQPGSTNLGTNSPRVSMYGAARGMGLFTSIAAVTVPVPPIDIATGPGQADDKFRLLV